MNALHRPALASLLVLLASLLCACRERTPAGGEPGSARSESSAAPSDPGPASAYRGTPGATTAPARIVSVGGPVTEIVYALGAGPDVVAVDTSSLYPDEANKLPKVGYQRTIATEGVLAQRPTLVLLSSEAGPPAAITQIQAAGIPTHVIPAEAQLDGIADRIDAVAKALGKQAEGDTLKRTVTAELDAVKRELGALPTHPRVLMIYTRGAGTQLVAGVDTPPDTLIRLAGGENAAATLSGYKPMTAEAVVAAAPEVILVPSRGLDALGGIDGILALPGVAQTPAGKARRVVPLDDLLLLGLGPRTPAAARDLARQLRAP
ncbi:heme/hemin ABC transporter substrate-binding protein [Chondromyces crocatus]|uniref:Hemin ABC transporter substrate-binding protein n=1 Tax=Chondromyces crocatus TaxID=52 RepID=A0A0K1EEX4_CHOCO|nr:ABC transporter substrate-binding protein [Chondromyces crocatus]AKT39425.1 hemin ABC transporter substrate-binding protein [Chondromyces crocatus]